MTEALRVTREKWLRRLWGNAEVVLTDDGPGGAAYAFHTRYGIGGSQEENDEGEPREVWHVLHAEDGESAEESTVSYERFEDAAKRVVHMELAAEAAA